MSSLDSSGPRIMQAAPEGRSVMIQQSEASKAAHVIDRLPSIATKEHFVEGSAKMSVKSHWRLSEVELAPVPPYLNLDRPVEVELRVQVVLDRVAHYMRVKSVVCRFFPDEKTIYGRTPSMLHFAIHLWRGESSPRHVIIELQRRKGCSVEMQRLRRSLFRALLTGQDPSAGPVECRPNFYARNICPIVKRMYEERTKASKMETTTCPKALCNADMTKCCGLLESSLGDEKRLGMEGLLMLTDPMIVAECGAEEVATRLVFGEGPGGKLLQDELLPYFQGVSRQEEEEKELFGSSLSPRASTCEDIEFMECWGNTEFEVNHRLALRVMANALEVVARSKGRTTSEASDDLDFFASEFWRTVVKDLVRNLINAAEGTQEAALSARCINLADEVRPGAASFFEKILPALIQARAVGELHHLELEKETQSLIGRLLG